MAQHAAQTSSEIRSWTPKSEGKFSFRLQLTGYNPACSLWGISAPDGYTFPFATGQVTLSPQITQSILARRSAPTWGQEVPLTPPGSGPQQCWCNQAIVFQERRGNMIYKATLVSPFELLLFTSSAQHRAENASSAAAVSQASILCWCGIAVFAYTVLALQCPTLSIAWCGHSLLWSGKHLPCNDQQLWIHYNPPEPALLTSSADRHKA